MKTRIFLLNIFLSISFLDSAQAHLHRKHVCDAYALTENVIVIEPSRDFKNRDDFFKTMAHDRYFALGYTRCIGRTVDRFDVLKQGFKMSFGQDEFGKFVVKLKAPDFKVTRQPISLDISYNPFHIYRKVLSGKSKKDTRFSKTTVMFRSYVGDVVLLPRKGYVSFYDFSKRAGAVEIRDLWRQVLVISTELDHAQKPYVFYSTAGTAGGQDVPHMSVQFEVQR